MSSPRLLITLLLLPLAARADSPPGDPAQREQARKLLEAARKKAREAQEAAKKAHDDEAELSRRIEELEGKRPDTSAKPKPTKKIDLDKDKKSAKKVERPPRLLAVLPFENHTGDAALDWMGHGVAEAMVSDLSRIGSITVVDRTQVDKLFQEKQLRELGFSEPEPAAEVAKLVGAQALVVGQVTREAQGIRLDGRVVDPAGNKVLQTATVSGARDELFELERQLAVALVGDYAQVTAKEKADLLTGARASARSLEAAARVRLLTASGKSREARAAYEKLLAESPELAAQLQSLKESWKNVAAKVAVLPLANATGRGDQNWIGVGLAEALTSDLRKLGLFVVERREIEQLFQERRLMELTGDKEATALGQVAGASMVVVGSFQGAGEELRVDVRLVEVSSGQILATWTVEGKQAALFDLEGQLAKKVALALEVAPSAVESAALGGKPSLDDFKRYIQASSTLALARGDGKKVEIHALAVGGVKDDAGAEVAAAGLALRQAVERMCRVPVQPQGDALDALIVGRLTRLGAEQRLDLRAVSPATSEVLASASANGAATGDARALVEKAAADLLASLGVKKVDEPIARAPVDSRPRNRSWAWALVGVGAALVAAGVTVGLLLGLPDNASPEAGPSQRVQF